MSNPVEELIGTNGSGTTSGSDATEASGASANSSSPTGPLGADPSGAARRGQFLGESRYAELRIAARAQLIGIVLTLALTGCGIIAYSWSLGGFWQACGSLAVMGAAAGISGAFPGFLFGIPRSVVASSDAPSGAGVLIGNLDPQVTHPSTNLEQISDWLTKILLGATLLQLSDILAGLRALFVTMGSAIGGGASAVVFVGALALFCAVAGFIQGWLAARIWLPWLIHAARVQGGSTSS